MNRISVVVALAFAGGLVVSGCGDKPAAVDPAAQRAINVTTVVARRIDLPVTEVAVGAETSLDSGLGAGAGSAQVRLPFPLDVARRLKPGQNVELRNFGDAQTGQGRVLGIRPALNATTASAEVIVEVTGPAGWRPHGSVRGEVVLEVHQQAVVIPEAAVVLRPAGSVVYLDDNGVAQERKVVTGVTMDGLVEIVEGLAGGESVVKDGAPMLSEGAKLREAETAR